MALQKTLLLPKEKIEYLLDSTIKFEEVKDSYKHLNTEKAFSLLEQIKAINSTLK